MMKRFGHWALALGLALGCGGESADDENGGGSGGGGGADAAGEVDTGLPEETPLQDVSPEQFSNACESLRQSVDARLGPDRAVAGVCQVVSAALTDDAALCATGADTCVDQVNAGDGPLGLTREQLDFTTFECGDTGGLQGCTATVGELETCLDDRMSAIEQLLEGNDCENAASVSLVTATALIDVGSMLPPSCSRLEQCPGLAPILAAPTP